MTRTITRLLALALLCILGTDGCALIGLPDPRDLAFSSVAAIYSNDISDYPWSSGLLRPPGNEKMLRIEFTTKFDLLYASYSRGYNIGNRMDFCEPSTDVYNGGVGRKPHVYWRGFAIDRHDDYDTDANLLKIYASQATRTFYVYLAVAYYASPNISHVFGEPPPLLYNLENEPENVCLRVEGGVMFGPTFRSNIVFIPKEVIANALAAAR